MSSGGISSDGISADGANRTGVGRDRATRDRATGDPARESGITPLSPRTITRQSLLLPAAAITAWGIAWLVTGWPGALPLVVALWVLTALLVAVMLIERTLGSGRRFMDALQLERVAAPDASKPPMLARVLRAASRGLSIAAACVAVGASMASIALAGHAGRQPEGLNEQVRGGRQTTVVIEVTSVSSDRFRGTIRSWRDADGTAISAAAPVAVFAAAPEAAGIGATVEAHGRMQQLDPGERTAYRLFPARVRLLAPGRALVTAMGELRTGFIEQVSTMPGNGAGLLPGLAIGDTRAVSQELDAWMKDVSLSHLTAVSGANCAIVTGLVLLLAARLRLPRWARIAAAVIALAGFVLLVTPEPSVLRAAVMALVVLCSSAIGRPSRGVPVLALSIIVLLVHDPWLAREFGFVLSVLATGGLLLLAGPLADRLRLVMPRGLATVVALPLAAQLACQPAIVLLDAALPAHGVVANLLAAPAAPAATVLGGLACLLLPVLPALAIPITWLAWLPSAWIAAVAQCTAALPLARIPWPEGLLGMLLMAGLTALLLVMLLVPARRRLAGVAFALVVAVLIGTTVGAGLLQRLRLPVQWQIAQCDIGQGDAIVLRSAGAVALIDTGPDPEALAGCLDRLGVGSLDLLVLTHFDHDHAGGTAAVHGRVGTALVGPIGRDADAAVVEALRQSGAEVVDAERGMWGVLGESRWRVLWPEAQSRQSGNGASVVLHVDAWGECHAGCPSALLLGDLGAAEQRRLLAAGAIGPVDVVKVSHHGSADQDAELYRRAAASVALIGVGATNSYGHPTEALLDILRATSGSVARSDAHGLVLIDAKSEGLSVWRESGGDAAAGAPSTVAG